MKDIIKNIITDFHLSTLKATRARNVRLPLNAEVIISVIGVRRSGKTYLLYQTIEAILQQNTPVTNILYLNFEDERLDLKQADLDLILQAYRELYPTIDLHSCYFFFDEIQNIPGWEKFIRRLFDTISRNIYVTGSNSKLLSVEIATELRGRTITYTLYPLSFSEFLEFNECGKNYHATNERVKIINHCRDFMMMGGFPELTGMEHGLKIKKLQDYFNSIIYKDIIERYNISNPLILKLFVKKILVQVTKPFSVNKLYNEIRSMGYKISNNLLYEFMDYIEATFAALVVNKFDFSEIKQYKSEKKLYSIDNGLLTALDNSFSENKGKLLENMIALEILKADKALTYFKSATECDFITFDKSSYYPIQVSYSIADVDTKQREIKGLTDACKHLGVNAGAIVTYDEEGHETKDDINIQIIPAYKFMLQL